MFTWGYDLDFDPMASAFSEAWPLSGALYASRSHKGCRWMSSLRVTSPGRVDLRCAASFANAKPTRVSKWGASLDGGLGSQK